VALVSLLIVFVVVQLTYRQEFSSKTVFVFQKPLPVGRVHTPHLVRSLIATFGMLIAFLLGVDVASAALVAAAWLLITRRIKPERIWNEVNWNLLVLFAGMFIVTHALEAAGLSQALFAVARPLFESGGLAFSGVSAILSNLVSNVPAVLLFLPVLKDGSDTAWLLLAMSSTLAGNLTLVGSVANLIVAEEATRRGVKIGFLEYLKLGVPITLLSILFGAWWLGL
jgi:Na+/H+ antiporter NhaD/arsenite permease-like protein